MFIPRFKLYNSAGDSLLYTFPVVQATNAPQSPKSTVVITTLRGKGCVVIDGGTTAWDLTIRGILQGDNYEALISEIDALESIQLNIPYLLRIDKSSSTYYSYKVKRIEPINYPDSFRTDIQEYNITFKVNSW